MNMLVRALMLGICLSLVPIAAAADDEMACSVADDVIEYDEGSDWETAIVDTRWRLPSAYRPADLVQVRRARVAGSGKVRTLVIPDLAAMAAGARAVGVRLVAHSAFRGYGRQVVTFRRWVRLIGYDRASKTSARPGHSEHQLGTAVDFASLGQGLTRVAVRAWASSPVGRWLAANAWQYGFVLSYPSGSMQQACYDFEPWHYRYVGREVAGAIHDSGQPPRIWLMTHPAPTPTPTPTVVPTPTVTPVPSVAPSPTLDPSPTLAPSPTVAPTPTFSPSPAA